MTEEMTSKKALPQRNRIAVVIDSDLHAPLHKYVDKVRKEASPCVRVSLPSVVNGLLRQTLSVGVWVK